MITKKNMDRPGSNVRPFLYKFLSYLIPLRMERTASEFNRYLEVIWYNGKLMLNTRQANYSYGNLLKAFREVFRSEYFKNQNPKRVLTLGLGAGCVPAELTRMFPMVEQDAVEIDPEVVALYERYFPQIAGLNIHIQDAVAFLEENQDTWDLIIVDLYVDLEVPSVFHSREFIQQLAAHCAENGMVIFNQVVRSEDEKTKVQELMALFSEKFGKVSFFTKSFINHFVIGKKKDISLRSGDQPDVDRRF